MRLGASLKSTMMASPTKHIRSPKVRFITAVAVILTLGGLSIVLSSRPLFAASTSTTVARGPALSLASFDFSNPSTGLGVFTQQPLSGEKCTDFVGKSTDGGARFDSLVRVMSWNCSSTEFSSSMTTDGRGDAFLYGPQLFVSHDNASAWSRVSQSGSVLDVDAVGLSVWMVESFCTAAERTATLPCPVRLIKSTNGGRTWVPSAESPPNAETGPLSGANGQSFLIRTSRSTAYFMLAPHHNLDGNSSVAPLWITSNGGDTWSNRQVPCHMGAMSSVLSIAPDGTMMAVCASEPSAGEQIKTVLESTNGGRTWIVKTGSNIDAGYLGAIDLVSRKEAFLVGDRSSLLVTRDGGNHWGAAQPLIGSTAGGTSQVRFFNSSHGLVLGNDDNDNEKLTLWRTVDGGTRWKVVVPKAG